MYATSHRPGREADTRNPGLIWFAEECLNNGVRLERYIDSAERRGDQQLAEFFRRALAESGQVLAGDPRRGRLRHVARATEFGCA